jgi:hypothetical protein
MRQAMIPRAMAHYHAVSVGAQPEKTTLAAFQ